MTHPFEDDNSEYTVLTNDLGQHCLWPTTVDVPDGWATVSGPASRQECLDYVERNWLDLRPSRQK